MHFRQAVIRTSAAAHRRRNSGALADEHLGGQQFLVEKQERRKLDQVWQPMVHRGRMDGHFAASNGPFCASIDLRAYCNLWIQAGAQHSIANDLFIVAEQISREGGATRSCASHLRMTCMRIPRHCHVIGYL